LLRSLVVWVAGSAAALAADQTDEPAPKRAAPPFRVHVVATPQGDEDVVDAILFARDRLEEVFSDKSDWFAVVDDAEQAEVLVDLQAYWVRERLVSRSQSYTQAAWGRIPTLNEVREHHSLAATVVVLGRPSEMTGADGSLGRADIYGAAKDLALQLERYVRDHYRELQNRRSESEKR